LIFGVAPKPVTTRSGLKNVLRMMPNDNREFECLR
jgi:hypothetical protein